MTETTILCPFQHQSKLASKLVTKVYLDQNAWIYLAQAHHGQSGGWGSAHQAVLEASDEERAIFPLSLSHLHETVRREDDGSRARLLEFMWKVSDGHAIRPWPSMLNPEARNAIRILAGNPGENLEPIVFGRGVPHMLGAEPALVPKTPDASPPSDDVRRKLSEIVYGSTPWELLKNPQCAAEVREKAGLDEDFAERLQEKIDEEYSHPDKARRQDIAEARFMTSVVGDALCRAMGDLVFKPKQFMAAQMTSKESIRKMLRLMPTFHTFYTLNHVRNTTREVERNDLWDFVLSIAISYCDVVVTESSWCGIAEHRELHELRDTQMVSVGDPGELAGGLERAG